MCVLYYNIKKIGMNINEFRLSVYCLLLKSIGVNQCLVHFFFFYFARQYPKDVAVGLTPFLGRLSIVNKKTIGHLKSFSQCLPYRNLLLSFLRPM